MSTLQLLFKSGMIDFKACLHKVDSQGEGVVDVTLKCLKLSNRTILVVMSKFRNLSR